MQSTKFKSLFNFVSVNKQCIRTIAVAASTVTSETNLKPWKEIPGPSTLPIIGQLHHFLPGGSLYNMDDPITVTELIQKYGPIFKLESLGRQPMVFLSDPESSAYVLRSENKQPVREEFMSLEYYRKVLKKKKGYAVNITGLVTDQGEAWQEFRSTVNPVMLQPKTIKLYTEVLDEVAQDMIIRMKANRNEKNMIRNEFDKEMNLWALESIGTVALGCRLNCFDPNLPKDSPAWQLIQCVQNVFIAANELDFKPSFWKWFATPTFKKAMKLYEHHDNLTKHFIQKGKEQLKNKPDSEKGVLEKLLEIDEEVAHVMASDLLFAGVNAPANTIIAILYYLATNPEKQTKLREEIMSSSERRPYLRACVKEAIRLKPAVAANLRRTTKEYNILGYHVPTDVDILFSHREMSLMEKHFPRADEFIPERWLVNKNDPLYYGNTHPFVYGPFGYGTRTCIGRRITEQELDAFMARLIENFQVEWFGPPPKTVETTLNYIQGPYNFIFNDVK